MKKDNNIFKKLHESEVFKTLQGTNMSQTKDGANSSLIDFQGSKGDNTIFINSDLDSPIDFNFRKEKKNKSK